MTRAALAALGLGLLGVPSCVYYNAMWSANHLAKEARRLEEQGRAPEARTYWARAAEKAESVVVRHPRSRWADDALVLQGEGLARSGACAAATVPLTRALEQVERGALRERAALAAAQCALDTGDPARAERLLAPVTDSPDAARRSRVALLAGQAAQMRGDFGAAVAWYGRSREPAAAMARARALLAGARTAEATALLATLMRGRFVEEDWAGVLDALASAAGAEEATGALDRLLGRQRVPVGSRARLLLADGDRLLARGALGPAAARYAETAGLVPDSTEGQRGRVREVRALAAQAESLPELAPLADQLNRPSLSGQGGEAGSEARALAAILERVLSRDISSETEQFRAAELARDSLGAARLAGHLFLRFAQQRPASLFAPKALVAALMLLPERRDSLMSLLDSAYATSPYALALRGELSPAYAAAEDSLARALGVQLQPAASLAARVAPPVPGPRGPGLETALASGSAAADTLPAAPSRRPAVPEDRRRPAGPKRPGGRPVVEP